MSVAGAWLRNHTLKEENLAITAAKSSPTVICILGMHRSGTSCLAGSLQAAGLFSGEVEDWNIGNLKGNRENLDIMTLNQAILKSANGSWDNPPSKIKWSQEHQKRRDEIIANFASHHDVWMFKEPRTLLTLNFWQEGINNLQFVGSFRNPIKVAMSLYQRSLGSISLRKGIELWLHYNRILLQEWKKSPFPLICFDFPREEYLKQLESIISHLSKYTNLDLEKAKKFYEAGLVHQKDIIAAAENSKDSDNQQLLETTKKLYQELQEAAGISIEEISPQESSFIVPLAENTAALEECIKIQPENPHLYFMLGNAKFQEEDFAAAIVSYKKAIELDSEYFWVYKKLAATLTESENLDEATGVYQELLKLQPENPDIYCNLGNIYRQQGDLEAATNTYRKAIKINPKYLAAYIHLANTLIQQKQSEEAIQVCNQAIEVKPENASLYRILGNAQLQAQDYKAASISYQQAIDLEPESAANYCSLGNLQMRQENLEAAKVNYEKAIELEPEYFWHYKLLGDAFCKLQQFKEAVAEYEKAIELDFKRPGLYVALGNAQNKLGDRQIAIVSYRRSLELNPKQFHVYTALGNTLFQLGKTEEAITAYTKAIKLDSNRPGVYAALGNAKLKCEQIKEAITAYQKAIELNPKQPFGVYKNLGDCLSKQGEKEGAIAAYNEALKLQPQNKVIQSKIAKHQLGNTNPMKLFQYLQNNQTPLRVCIINFTGERKNWGCQATSWELVRILNRLWPQPKPFKLEVIPLLPHHALDREIPTHYGKEIRAAFANPNPTEDQKKCIEEISRKRYLQYFDILKRADLVLFQAEGTMTGTDFLRAERLLLLPWLATHVFNKPVISLNQTLFSANSNFSQILFTVLNSFSQVWVRELASYNWLQANGFKGVRLVPDTAFLTDPLDHGNLWKVIEGKNYFCVTGSAALFEDDIPNYLKAIRSIAQATGLFPVFLCSTGRDLLLLKYAKENWPEGSFGQVNRNLIYPAVAHCLGKAHFLVGGRYHLSILAAINGTPSVLIRTNTHKLNGLVEMLKVNWQIRNISHQELLVADALKCLECLENSRISLKLRVAQLRDDIITAFQDCPEPRIESFEPIQKLNLIPPVEQEVYLSINQQIASRFKYPDKDTPQAKLGAPQEILPQLINLTVYLRRNQYPEATFSCLHQLVEGNLDLVIDQLNSRWLISLCDSYADFGKPIEARNALLISTFMNWERLAASYIHWSDPNRKTRRVDNPVDPKNQPLWDGLITVQLTRGDTVNNLLIRYAKLLENTPHLLKIWRALLDRLKNNDSVMSALNEPHGYMFDENLDWIKNGNYDHIYPPWRRL